MAIKGWLAGLAIALVAAFGFPFPTPAAGSLVWDYELIGGGAPALSPEDEQTLAEFVGRAFPQAAFGGAGATGNPEIWTKRGKAANMATGRWTPPHLKAELSPAVICPVAPYSDARLTESQTRRWPYSTVGKLFTDCADESNRTSLGSGVVVGRDLVMTAASNIYDGSFVEAADLCFSPAYYDGDEPYGTWRPISLGVLSLYRLYEWPCVNVGFMIMETKNGRSISSYSGQAGIAVNLENLGRQYYTIGYPTSSYSGEFPIITRAFYALDDEQENRWSCAPPMGIGGEMGKGAQGGPWLTEHGGDFYVNGLTAYTYRSCPEVQYSPYFGDEVLRGYRQFD